jgi:hypothetical protein
VSEWKPGDVALVDSWRGKGQIAFRVGRGENIGWCVLDGTDSRGLDDDEVGDNARPVVVIDPEDAEQVERLASALFDVCAYSATHSPIKLAAALREFARPTPPRPEEPTGLGAVVEDAEGKRWVRSVVTPARPWYTRNKSKPWDEIVAVRVLSEGVQP